MQANYLSFFLNNYLMFMLQTACSARTTLICVCTRSIYFTVFQNVGVNMVENSYAAIEKRSIHEVHNDKVAIFPNSAFC
jgi:hypothetical protein